MGVSLSLLGVDRPGSCGGLIAVWLRHHVLSHGPSPLTPRYRGQDPEYGLPVDVLEGEVDLVCSWVYSDGVGVRSLVLANRLQCGSPLVEDRNRPRLGGDVEAAPVRIEGEHIGANADGVGRGDRHRLQIDNDEQRVAL